MLWCAVTRKHVTVAVTYYSLMLTVPLRCLSLGYAREPDQHQSYLHLQPQA